MESTDERTLRTEIPPCYVTASTGVVFDGLSGLNGWQLDALMPNVPYWTGTIDLSGYVREYKTFYPKLGFIQEGPYWTCFGGTGQTVLTIISSIPLNPVSIGTQLSGNGGPGFIDLNTAATGVAQQNWETVLFCETQVNLINANLPGLGICQPITNKQSGSLSATASDTLYILKLVVPSTIGGQIGDDLSIPASRVILSGTFGAEPDVQYMMRLKRSVELANQV